MDEIQKLKKRLGMAEKALMRIDSIFNDSDRPSQIVSEYFEKVNEWWFDTENTSSNSDYAKKPSALEFARICTREGIDPMTSGLIYNLFFA